MLLRVTINRLCLLTLAVGISCLGNSNATAQLTVARQWNEAQLDAIRIDYPAPTVHSRNLYHSSAAMYDAWATYDNVATGVFYQQSHSAANVDAARDEAISYAAYRVLSQRYANAQDPAAAMARFDGVMNTLGYDKNVTTVQGNSPAAIGNRIAAKVLSSSLSDGANEVNNYADNTNYAPVNGAMIVDHPSLMGPNGGVLADRNRWQPLYTGSTTGQNGMTGTNLQQFLSPHWGSVRTFALGKTNNSGPHSWSGIDPGAPPMLGGTGDAAFRTNIQAVIRYSSGLDPTNGLGSDLINISPNAMGNNGLGQDDGVGRAINPATNQPYADNFAKRGDYGRVLAEFWADGPNSETPPGHWNVLANEVSDHAMLSKRIGGQGPVVSGLEWDVKMYLGLNGAVHDSAVAAWGVKRQYDYVRPITMIRYMGGMGQSSDPGAASYHADGLTLENDLVELITVNSILSGGKHHNAYLNANRQADGTFVADLHFTEAELVGKIAINAWNHEPTDPATQISGVDWILAENWVPFQQDNFVTPPFAAFVSGHSTFSRAAAEVLTEFTGSEFFPGGMAEANFMMNDTLKFEMGPSGDMTLQWATYFDAADEAGISRLYGGIHVSPDDFAGRIMGQTIGQEAFAQAMRHFQGVPEPSTLLLASFALLGVVGRRRRR